MMMNFSTQVEQASASIIAVHGRRGIGSSGISWQDNLILTSAEGVRVEEGIKVLLPDGRVTTAKLRGRDSGTDLAVLEVEAVLPKLEFADDKALKVGQLALAVGRTLNTGPIASLGMISGVSTEWKTWRGGKIDPFVRLDISAYSTLSGGPVLDEAGKVIGLVSTGLSRSSVFAITRSTIDRIAGKLSQQGYVSRGFLGVTLQQVGPGIMLIGVDPEGPAAASGLLLGDVLVEFAQPELLSEFLERTPAGQTVKLKVLRAGVLQDLEVRVGERPRKK
jgi:S1-C subfamily serine protease